MYGIILISIVDWIVVRPLWEHIIISWEEDMLTFFFFFFHVLKWKRLYVVKMEVYVRIVRIC